MAGILDTAIDELDTALNNGTYGVNRQLDSIDSQATFVGAIYKHWDIPDRIIESCALLVERDQVFEVEAAQTSKRDWTFRFIFRYVNDSAEADVREKNAGWVAQAILKTISSGTAQPQSRMSSAILVTPRGGSTLFGRVEDGRDEAVVMIADIVFREDNP